MNRTTFVRSFLTGLGIAVVASACTPENISAPPTVASASVAPSAAKAPPGPPAPAAQNPGLSGPPQPAITRKHALKNSITVTQTVGAGGGTIKIGQAGLTVVFSPGALLSNTSITVTADSGSLISYEFGPHGTQFHAPVAIEQDMQQTTIDKKLDQANSLYGGYMPDGTADIVGDSASVSEMHKAETSIGLDQHGKPQMKQSVYIVWHFSGYILIGARR